MKVNNHSREEDEVLLAMLRFSIGRTSTQVWKMFGVPPHTFRSIKSRIINDDLMLSGEDDDEVMKGYENDRKIRAQDRR